MKTIALAGVVVAAGIAAAWFWSTRIEPRYQDERRVSWAYEVRNLGNTQVTDGRLTFVVPAPMHPAQMLRQLEVQGDYSVIDDAAGNRLIEITLEPLPPYGSLEVRVSATVAMAEEPNRWTLPNPSDWLQPQPGMESDAPAVVSLARELHRRRPGDTLEAIESWLRSNLQATGYDAVDRGALFALEHRSGDCTEFAYLAVALARALAIPARAVDGWVIDGDTVLDPAGFHTWAEVWDGATWRRLDAHREPEPDRRVHYLAVRIVPADASAFASTFTRFRIDGSGLVARMK